jgi:ABC-type dipeptide/oligopeptide/nickel transport system permease component
MQRYILGRVVQSVLCLLIVSFVVFYAARLTGDPTVLLLSEMASREDAARLRAHLGLDRPMLVQYGVFLSHAVRGDLGESTRVHRPVIDVLFARFPASLQLGTLAILISLLIAVPIGVYSAAKQGGAFDVAGRMVAVLGQALPLFWLGLMLMLIFAVWLGLLPAAGRGSLRHLILPAVTMGWATTAAIMRLTRSAMLEVLDSEYVKLARIKGLSEWWVVWKHAFKNALLPVVTFSVLLFAEMIAGAVVTETVFAWPGVGQLLISSVYYRDFPMVQGTVLLLSTLFVLGNFGVDILYAYLNPKIRYRP